MTGRREARRWIGDLLHAMIDLADAAARGPRASRAAAILFALLSAPLLLTIALAVIAWDSLAGTTRAATHRSRRE